MTWQKTQWVWRATTKSLAKQYAPSWDSVAEPKRGSTEAAHLKAADAKAAEWWWEEFITIQENGHSGKKHVRVELCGTGMRDTDLESLMKHVDALLGRMAWTNDSTPPTLTIDLACNLGITDYGVRAHLRPFLARWPHCERLKLYRTSVGDGAINALSSWIAEGYAREVHLSDLGRPVTGEAVLECLRAIHTKGRYPYCNSAGVLAPLWLRLEHNGIEDADEVVNKGNAEGMSLRVLGKMDLATVRPGGGLRRASEDNTAVHLVLFRMQSRKVPLQDTRAAQGQELMTMLHVSPQSSPCTFPREDPQPLSADEFRLWEMEAREDLEGGADERNHETFGTDDRAGWTFEENLAANERLAHQAQWKRIPLQVADRLPPPRALISDPQSSHWPGREQWTFSVAGDEGVGECFEDLEQASASSGISKQRVAKNEVDDEIGAALAISTALRRSDFDGRVRQYLHAIHTKGGTQDVKEAMRAINAAVLGKTRANVKKWPAYLVALLKRYFETFYMSSEEQKGRRDRRRQHLRHKMLDDSSMQESGADENARFDVPELAKE